MSSPTAAIAGMDKAVSRASAPPAYVVYANKTLAASLPPQKIPRRIIQCGLTYESALATRGQYMHDWWGQNPEYEYEFFSESAVVRFIAAHGTADERMAYSALATGAQRADLFRVYALKYLGGVYADIDCELRMPLRAVRAPWRRASAVVGGMWTTEFLAFTPHHELITRVAATLTHNVLRQLSLHRSHDVRRCKTPHSCVLNVAGPFAFRWAVIDHATHARCRLPGELRLNRSYTALQCPDDFRSLHVCTSDRGNIYRTWACDAVYHWDCRNSGAKRRCGNRHYSRTRLFFNLSSAGTSPLKLPPP